MHFPQERKRQPWPIRRDSIRERIAYVAILRSTWYTSALQQHERCLPPTYVRTRFFMKTSVTLAGYLLMRALSVCSAYILQ